MTGYTKERFENEVKKVLAGFCYPQKVEVKKQYHAKTTTEVTLEVELVFNGFIEDL